MAPLSLTNYSNSYSFFLENNFSFLRVIKQLISKYMNVVASSYSSINLQLKDITKEYLAIHPGLTLNALANRSGVAATTLRRLMQDENHSVLAPHTVLSLVSYLLKEKRISNLLKKIDGPVGDFLRKSFDQFIFDDSVKHEISSDLNSILKDKTNYLIYKLAANQCGTTILEIKSLFGLVGLKKLNELISLNWIYADDEDHLHAKEKNFSIDLALAHQHAHALIDQYKPEAVDRGYNLFYSLSEGMNEDGIQKIKVIEKDAVKKIFELMNDPEMQGELPYFSIILSDIFGLYPQSSTGVLQ